MKQRIITASILIAFVLLILFVGGAAIGVAAMAGIGIATYEEFKALRAAKHRPIEWPTWMAAVLAVPLTCLWGLEALGILLVVSVMITLALVMFRKDPQLTDALVSLLPLVSIVLPGLCIVSIAFIKPMPVQRVMLLLIIAVPVLGDTLAYFIGSYVRGPKLCPAISPNKTISGAIAGLVGSVLAAAIIGVIAYFTCRGIDTIDTIKVVLPHWWTYAMLGIFGGIASQMGDLFASMVKRHCGIKDFSNLFPGHGGMLDRIDSILFMAIVVFCVCMLGGRFWPA